MIGKYTQTLAEYMMSRDLDPFKDEDLLKTAKSLNMYYYEGIPRPIMDKLLIKFIGHYLMNEIGYLSLDEFRLRLITYMRDRESWYTQMYENYKNLLPFEMLNRVVEVEGRDSLDSVDERKRDDSNITTSDSKSTTDTIDDSTGGSHVISDNTTVNDSSGESEDKAVSLADKKSDTEGSEGGYGKKYNYNNTDSNDNKTSKGASYGKSKGDSEAVVAGKDVSKGTTNSKTSSQARSESGVDSINRNNSKTGDQKYGKNKDETSTEGIYEVHDVTSTGTVKGYGSYEEPTEQGILADNTEFRTDDKLSKTDDGTTKTVDNKNYSQSESETDSVGFDSSRNKSVDNSGTNEASSQGEAKIYGNINSSEDSSSKLEANATTESGDAFSEAFDVGGEHSKSKSKNNEKASEVSIDVSKGTSKDDMTSTYDGEDITTTHNNKTGNIEAVQDSNSLVIGDGFEKGSRFDERENYSKTTTSGIDAWKPELARKFYEMYVGIDAEWVKGARNLFLLIY